MRILHGVLILLVVLQMADIASGCKKDKDKYCKKHPKYAAKHPKKCPPARKPPPYCATLDGQRCQGLNSI